MAIQVHNVRLPEDVERGSKFTPNFSTTINETNGGHEASVINWGRARHTFDISYGIDGPDTWETVKAFFMNRFGRGYGFLFKDWSDYSATDSFIGTGNGVNRVFQCSKRYSDGTYNHDRRVTRLVSGTFSVKVNGVTVAPANYAVNVDTGVLTFDPGQAPANLSTVTATFEFLVPVRFGQDDMQIELEWAEAGSIPSITLVEVRE